MEIKNANVNMMIIRLYESVSLFKHEYNMINSIDGIINIIPPMVGVFFLLLCVLIKYLFKLWDRLNFFNIGIRKCPKIEEKIKLTNIIITDFNSIYIPPNL